MLSLNNIKKSFHRDGYEIRAVDGVSLQVEKGEIYGIIGYSGAGKSTLIRCINILERPDQGEVIFKGENICKLNERELRERRKKIGMIFQHFNLFDSRNVYRNIAYPLKGSGLTSREIDNKVLDLLKLVGLEDKAASYPSQLSGGEKQRVAIARALANDPDILLCDEATSALDPKTTNNILGLLRDLRNKLDLTIVLITHEMEVIKSICDRVSIMEGGRVVEEGRVVDIFTDSKTATARDFINIISNSENIYEAIVGEKNIFNIGADDEILKISYGRENVLDNIISKVSRKYQVDICILYGNINIIGEIPIGQLIVVVKGEKTKIEATREYLLSKNLKVEVIKNGRNIKTLHTKCS